MICGGSIDRLLIGSELGTSEDSNGSTAAEGAAAERSFDLAVASSRMHQARRSLVSGGEGTLTTGALWQPTFRSPLRDARRIRVRLRSGH